MKYIGNIQQYYDIVNKGYVDGSLDLLDTSMGNIYGWFNDLSTGDLIYPTVQDGSVTGFTGLNKGSNGQLLTIVNNAYTWVDMDLTEVGGENKFIKAVSQADGQVSATEEALVNTTDATQWANANDASVPTVGAVQAAIENAATAVIEDLDLASSGAGKVIRDVTQEDGQVAVTAETAVTTITLDDGTNDSSIPTVGAVRNAVLTAISDASDRIDALELAQVGDATSVLRWVKQEDGQVSAQAETVASNMLAAETGDTSVVNKAAVKSYVDASIEALDVTAIGNPATQIIRSVSEIDGKIDASAETAVTSILTDNTQDASIPTVGAIKSYVNGQIGTLTKALTWWGIGETTTGANDLDATIDNVTYHVHNANVDGHTAWETGDVIYINTQVDGVTVSKEYVYNTNAWQLVGDESNVVNKLGGQSGVITIDSETLQMNTANNTKELGVKVNTAASQHIALATDSSGIRIDSSVIAGDITMNTPTDDGTTTYGWAGTDSILVALQHIENYMAKTVVSTISGSGTQWTIEHGLGTTNVAISVYDGVTGQQVMPDIYTTNQNSVNSVKISIVSPLGTNIPSGDSIPTSLKVVIVGSKTSITVNPQVIE